MSHILSDVGAYMQACLLSMSLFTDEIRTPGRKTTFFTHTLQKIHVQKYVHGDIRQDNLVFNEDGINSWIIDFDMAAKNGKYCKGYTSIHTIEERHPGAIQGSKMKIQHDCHSLRKTVDTKKKFDDIISAIKDTSKDLRTIASHIVSS